MKKAASEDKIISISDNTICIIDDNDKIYETFSKNSEILVAYKTKFTFNKYNYINLDFIKSHFFDCIYDIFHEALLVKISEKYDTAISIDKIVFKELFIVLHPNDRLKLLGALLDCKFEKYNGKKFLKELESDFTDNERLYLKMKGAIE